MPKTVLTPPAQAESEKDLYLQAFRWMLLARTLDEKLASLYRAGKIPGGGVYLGKGQEAFNQAAVEPVPRVATVADNPYAYSTPTTRQFACRSLVLRAEGYGVTGHQVDGINLQACLRTLRTAAQNARSGGGPQLVVA